MESWLENEKFERKFDQNLDFVLGPISDRQTFDMTDEEGRYFDHLDERRHSAQVEVWQKLTYFYFFDDFIDFGMIFQQFDRF